MKRTLPAIIILISLSLLGLIIMQANWLNNLLEVRQLELQTKVNSAVVSVANDLGSHLFDKGTIRLKRRLQGLNLDNSIYSLLKPPTVDQRFTESEIENKLANAFRANGLPNQKFEFAVVNSNSDVEMQTKNFPRLYYDSVNNKRVIYPISPEGGTDFENLNEAEELAVIVPKFTNQIWASLFWTLAGAALFMLIIIAAFYITVRTLLQQKKLSEIKSDFINNMTHEFKTPIATISLAVDALRNEKVQNNKEQLNYFGGIIKEENKRMNKHVETILQAALLEKQELQFTQNNVQVHSLIKKVIDNFNLQLQEKQANIILNLNAANDLVQADELHLTNVISNLVDNAIKYSNENLEITISTKTINKKLQITIADNGIGMNKETQKRVFEKFFRAHTGNVHNVKGFGLGMSYVKTIIDAMKANISVQSTLGKGTTFTINFPTI